MKKIFLVLALLVVFLVSCNGEEGSSYGTNLLGPGSDSITKTQNNTTDVTIVDGDTAIRREHGIAGN